MIISVSKKFIYIRTLKTATTTTEAILSKYLNKNDYATELSYEEELFRSKYYKYNNPVIGINYQYLFSKDFLHTVYLSIKSNFIKTPKPRYFTKKKKFTQHMSIEEILMNKDYNNFQFITSIRNPITNLFSFYNWQLRKKNFYLNFDDFVLKEASNFFKQQMFILGNNLDIYQFVIRFENIINDLNNFGDRFLNKKNIADDLQFIHFKKNKSLDKLILSKKSINLIYNSSQPIVDKYYKNDFLNIDNLVIK